MYCSKQREVISGFRLNDRHRTKNAGQQLYRNIRKDEAKITYT
jgi:hypothetical protein